MRKVVHFSKRKSWFIWEPDLDLLNQQISEMENDGWKLISIQPNCNYFGDVSSYTLLIEYHSQS